MEDEAYCPPPEPYTPVAQCTPARIIKTEQAPQSGNRANNRKLKIVARHGQRTVPEPNHLIPAMRPLQLEWSLSEYDQALKNVDREEQIRLREARGLFRPLGIEGRVAYRGRICSLDDVEWEIRKQMVEKRRQVHEAFLARGKVGTAIVPAQPAERRMTMRERSEALEAIARQREAVTRAVETAFSSHDAMRLHGQPVTIFEAYQMIDQAAEQKIHELDDAIFGEIWNQVGDSDRLEQDEVFARGEKKMDQRYIDRVNQEEQRELEVISVCRETGNGYTFPAWAHDQVAYKVYLPDLKREIREAAEKRRKNGPCWYSTEAMLDLVKSDEEREKAIYKMMTGRSGGMYRYPIWIIEAVEWAGWARSFFYTRNPEDIISYAATTRSMMVCMEAMGARVAA
jgi:hypothetical protein